MYRHGVRDAPSRLSGHIVGWAKHGETHLIRRVTVSRNPIMPLEGEAMPFKCNEPAIPTIQQEDATVRVTRWDFAPGAATGWHTHGFPYFVVLLTDAVLKIEAADGALSEVPLRAGQSYRRPAGIEHDVMNGSPHPIAFIEIEIKRPEELGKAT
jgi:mannose-6-phosphate isomerase-like protein (cupin superfamily)